ncbi:hypothetical protein GCM10009779_64230 [Polymorphospora rubra]|uniref:Uncharacterized protein n=1 Tax=Polymorphospora rubra TaxID=338584 RepID=A0A810N025_9ACTN|nr:hypothetical protein Prubr_21640 [Polymorphospora rubra]
MQPGAVGQPGVGERRTVVEAAPAGGGEPLGQPPHVVDPAERHRHPAQSPSPVDPDRGAVDEDVGDVGVREQRGEWAGADEVVVHPGRQA